MAKGKSSSKSKKDYLSVYKATNRQFINRKKKLERHIKRFPNDITAKVALKNLTPENSYRRKRPMHPYWTADLKKHAHVERLLGGNGNTVLILKKPPIWK